MSAAREKEVAVATNNCDCKLGGQSGRGQQSLMTVADMSFGKIQTLSYSYSQIQNRFYQQVLLG